MEQFLRDNLRSSFELAVLSIPLTIKLHTSENNITITSIILDIDKTIDIINEKINIVTGRLLPETLVA